MRLKKLGECSCISALSLLLLVLLYTCWDSHLKFHLSTYMLMTCTFAFLLHTSLLNSRASTHWHAGHLNLDISPTTSMQSVPNNSILCTTLFLFHRDTNKNDSSCLFHRTFKWHSTLKPGWHSQPTILPPNPITSSFKLLFRIAPPLHPLSHYPSAFTLVGSPLGFFPGYCNICQPLVFFF